MQTREPTLIGRPDATLPKSPGLTYQQLLEADSRPVPEILRESSPRYLGSHDIPVERYTSRAFHELEVEKLWKRVWQMACREEDLPAVGDHVVYEIANFSVLVVRSAPDSIRAFHNVCLHRGRLLKERDGNAREIRCSFHGFTWSLDGSSRACRAPGTSRTSTPRSSRCPSSGSGPGAASCS